MPRNRVTWVDDLSPNLDKFPDNFHQAVQMVMRYHEPQVESYMKTTAPWTDRTTNARNGLSAKYVRSGTVHSIVCFHQVPYGIWLEVANNGKYRIIVPTLVSQGCEVMKTMDQVFKRMR